jgi:propionyl-CoA synthetase
MKPVRGSPGLPNLGYRMKVIDENTGEEVAPGRRGAGGVATVAAGCMSTVWNDDSRFLQSYFSHFRNCCTARWTGRSATTMATPSSSAHR